MNLQFKSILFLLSISLLVSNQGWASNCGLLLSFPSFSHLPKNQTDMSTGTSNLINRLVGGIPSFELKKTSYPKRNAKLATVEYLFRENSNNPFDQVYVSWKGHRVLIYQGEIKSIPYNHHGFKIPKRVRAEPVAYESIYNDINEQTSLTTTEGTIFIFHDKHIQNFPDQPEDYDRLHIISLPDHFPDSRYFKLRETIEDNGHIYRVMNMDPEGNSLLSAQKIREGALKDSKAFAFLIESHQVQNPEPFSGVYFGSLVTTLSKNGFAKNPIIHSDGRLTVEIGSTSKGFQEKAFSLSPTQSSQDRARTLWGQCELIDCAPPLIFENSR